MASAHGSPTAATGRNGIPVRIPASPRLKRECPARPLATAAVATGKLIEALPFFSFAPSPYVFAPSREITSVGCTQRREGRKGAKKQDSRFAGRVSGERHIRSSSHVHGFPNHERRHRSVRHIG
jgi:hypothetical protein